MKKIAILLAISLCQIAFGQALVRDTATADIVDVAFRSDNPQQIEDVLQHRFNPIMVKGKLFVSNVKQTDKTPAMVVLHGSGGITEGREYEYGAKFNKLGMNVLVVDTYGTRGADKMPYLKRLTEVSAYTQAADAIGALNFLSSYDGVDPKRIGVIGFSLGGITSYLLALEKINEHLANGANKFAANIDLYGPCFSNFRNVKSTNAPFLFVAGDKDESINLDDCRNAFNQLNKSDSYSKFVVIEGAHHAWEWKKPRQYTKILNLRDCKSIVEDDGSTYFVKTNKTVPGTKEKFEEFAKCAIDGYTMGSNPQAEKISDATIFEFIKGVFQIN